MIPKAILDDMPATMITIVIRRKQMSTLLRHYKIMTSRTQCSCLTDTRMKITIVRVEKVFEDRVLYNAFDILHIEILYKGLGGPMKTNE